MSKLLLSMAFSLVLTDSMAKTETKTCSPADVAIKKGDVVTKKYLSDNEIRQLSKDLVNKIDFSKIKGLVAITRGGMAPASYISQFQNIKNIRSISISSYGDDCKRGELSVLSDPKLDNQGEGFLFVDDLVDSGETLRKIRAMYPKAKFAVLYAKPAGEPSTDYYAKKVPQGEWLIFPWESDWVAPKNS